ncbi:MAG TPA: hypothetical protein VGI39_13390 [Polyangiaceae bacterium]
MRRTALLGVVCLVASGCSHGVKPNTGSGAYMTIHGAQFFSGAMPAGSPNGPSVDTITLVNNDIYPGFASDPIGGSLAPSATAAAIGLDGDIGYWIVPAGVPAVATPDEPSFSATAAFSLGIVPGKYTLVVRAVDASGTFGPPSTQILVEEDSPTNPPSQGDLVVTLTWDDEADLDLHVVDPNGNEIYWAGQSSFPSAVDGGDYGYIDVDSNANCILDGLRREDAIWPSGAPSGHYLARVDTPSLCGQPVAHYTVRALVHGVQVAGATGVVVADSTLGAHGAGAGVLALAFDVP